MKHKINIIKKIDALMGPLLLKIAPIKYTKKPSNIKQILVIRPGGMGDAALLLPALKEIKVKYPKIIIDILCESRNSGIFFATPCVNKIELYDNPKSMLHLFNQKYDVIFDTEQSHFLSAIICRILKGKYKVGFDVFGRGKLFNKSVSYRHNLYEVQSFKKLFQQIFDLPEFTVLNPPYFKEKEKSKAVDEILKYGKDKKIVCIFTGATINERLWPENRWVDVVRSLSKLNYMVVLLGGKMEKKQCQTIKSLCKNKNVLDMSGNLSLLQTSWLFSKSNLLISTDSGILHLGVLSNIPTVSLFGSGIAAKWAPKGDRHIIINKKLNCSPCTHFGSTPVCLYDKACIASITIDDVLKAASNILEKIG